MNNLKMRLKNIISKENNRDIFKNVIFSFFVKGLSIILALFTTPAYMRYFSNDTALGVWFAVVSIINWVLMFDLGIGNGLRNKLPKAMETKNKKLEKELISSSYISITVLSIIFLMILLIFNCFINWNAILNVETTVLSIKTLRLSIGILIIGIVFRLVLNLNASIFFAIQKSSINNFIGLCSTLFLFLYVYFSNVGDISSNFIKLSIANTILSNLPLLIGTIYIFAKPFKGMFPSLRYFKMKTAKEILKIGTVLLWLQIIFMIVASTHAFLITNIRNPAEVVEYNIYYRVYYGILSIFYLSLTPIWSAVTKAQAKSDYKWIYKLYLVLLALTIPFVLVNFASIPFLQKFFDIWLKENTVTVNIKYVLIFIFFNFCFSIHNVNTSIFNGLSDFKIQNIWMTVAVIIFIPLCWMLSSILNNWSGVILGSAICVIPYEIIQIIIGLKKLNSLKNKTVYQGD